MSEIRHTWPPAQEETMVAEGLRAMITAETGGHEVRLVVDSRDRSNDRLPEYAERLDVATGETERFAHIMTTPFSGGEAHLFSDSEEFDGSEDCFWLAVLERGDDDRDNTLHFVDVPKKQASEALKRPLQYLEQV